MRWLLASSSEDGEPGWRVIVVHKSIDVGADKIKSDEDLSRVLSERVAALSADEIDHVIARLEV